MKAILIVLMALALTACTSYGDYYKSVDSANARQVEMALAQAKADEARYTALMHVANSGDATAKVAAVMAMAGLGQPQRGGQMAIPNQPVNEALQWASVLVPGATQLGQGYMHMKQGINASDNATRLGLSTNATFKHFASEISKPPLVVEQPAPIIVQPPPYNDPIIIEQPPPIIIETPMQPVQTQ